MTHVPEVVVGEGVVLDTRRVGLEGIHVGRVEDLARQGLLGAGATAGRARHTAAPVGCSRAQTADVVTTRTGRTVRLAVTLLARAAMVCPDTASPVGGATAQSTLVVTGARAGVRLARTARVGAATVRT